MNRDQDAVVDAIESDDGPFETVEYDPETAAYRAYINTYLNSVRTAIVEGVSAIEGTGPEQLNSLYSVIDPDALDGLFKQQRSPQDVAQVQFSLERNDTTVSSDGWITFRPSDTEEGSDIN